MRRQMLAILAVFAFLGPAGRSVADCQDGPRFGQAIMAQDKSSFMSTNPVDLGFVKEDVAALSDSTTRNRRRS